MTSERKEQELKTYESVWCPYCGKSATVTKHHFDETYVGRCDTERRDYYVTAEYVERQRITTRAEQGGKGNG